MQSDTLEEGYAIKLCFKFGKNATETYGMLQIAAFRPSYMQLQQQLEYTLLNPDCHSLGISKMLSGCEDTLEERYAIKLF